MESEAVEREQNRPAEDQDSEILNSPYYSPQYSRLKKIIGILDDDSATKYNPIFGDNFIFVIPYKEVSYDYFHPTVYGMFKSNFVGNRTSLRYFLAFSDFIFSKNGKGYHLHFCNITNGVLNENGSLQKNYNSCINYFRTNKHSVVAGIMFFVSLVSTAALIFITYRHFLKNKKRNNLSSSSCLMILLTCLFLSILIFYLLRYFVFMSFYLPTLSIGGFGLLLFADLSVIVLLLLLLKKKMHCSDSIIERVNQKEMAARTSKLEKWRFAYFLRQAAISVLLGIFIFILINVLASKTSTSSIGIPAIAAISGIIVAVFIDKYIFVSEYFNVKKRMLLKELICSGLAFLGISIGIIAGATFGHFDFIWISGIGFSIQKIAVSFVAAILIYLSLFWAALILRDMFIQFKSQCDNRFGKGSDYETLDI